MIQTLQTMHVDAAVICGVKANACIRVSAIAAYQHDYEVIFPRDGVAASDESEHSSTLQYLNKGIAEVMDCEQVVQ
jgi:isochorismate hydrolase